MADPDEETRRLLDELDRIVRDAEKVRAKVEESMRRDPFWPDRRDTERWWVPEGDKGKSR